MLQPAAAHSVDTDQQTPAEVAVALRVAAVAWLFVTTNHAQTPFGFFLGDEEFYIRRSIWLRNVALGVPIHSADLIAAFDSFFSAPRSGEVYNVGGGRDSNCSMTEAIEQCERISGRQMAWTYSETNRIGDHIWWISSNERFKSHFPDWEIRRTVPTILSEIYEQNRERWSSPGTLVTA